MRRCNFTLDDRTVSLLEQLADERFGGNRSEAIRVAIHSLAGSAEAIPGWVVAGFTPVEIAEKKHCHCCHDEFSQGDTLYRPVFELGKSPNALAHLPSGDWLDCAKCAGGHL